MAYGNQTLGRGEVWFSRYKPGTQTPEGYRYLGNTPELSLSIDTTFLDHFNSDRGIREKDKSIPLETSRTGSLTADDIQLDNLAYFFFGSKAILAQTSATAQTEPLADVIPGRMYQIGVTTGSPTGVRAITAVVVAKGATPLTIVDDYVVDAARGTVTLVEGGAVVAGDDLTVTYSRSAVSRNQVISGTLPTEGALMFVSYNPEGEKIDFRMPYVKLSPNGDFSLKGDDWQTIPFTLEILRLAGREAIYADGQPYAVA